MQLNVEKSRIIITRMAAVAAAVALLGSKSRWEESDGIMTLVLFVAGIVLVGIASLGRMWCSLYIAGYKDETLITTGPYSVCRNPLYFFSLLGAAGIGLCTETVLFPLAFLVLFALYYPFVIKSEEKRLKKLFGDQFESYAHRVPAFFPNRSLFEEPENYRVNPAVYRVHMYSALWFVWIVGILEVVEGLREAGLIGALWAVY